MKNLLLLTLVALSLSCTKKNYQQHNSMNSVDWAGRYEGVLPAKGSAGDPVVLVLKRDLSYELERNSKKTEGAFAWGPDGGHIVIPAEALHLFVGENFMKVVTKKGKEVEGGKFRLEKTENLGIREKYWKLVELNGRSVTVQEGAREPHMIIKQEGSRVIGNGGCNNFSGSYELDQTNGRIRFTNVASTRMACMEDTYEGEFFQVLNEADNFSTDGKTLSLNKARRAPLARFEVVYLK